MLKIIRLTINWILGKFGANSEDLDNPPTDFKEIIKENAKDFSNARADKIKRRRYSRKTRKERLMVQMSQNKRQRNRRLTKILEVPEENSEEI